MYWGEDKKLKKVKNPHRRSVKGCQNLFKKKKTNWVLKEKAGKNLVATWHQNEVEEMSAAEQQPGQEHNNAFTGRATSHLQSLQRTRSTNPFSRTPISLILLMFLREPGTRARPLSAFISSAAAKDMAVLHADFNHSPLPRQGAPRPESETAAASFA